MHVNKKICRKQNPDKEFTYKTEAWKQNNFLWFERRTKKEDLVEKVAFY
jgi:hypothetical protein